MGAFIDNNGAVQHRPAPGGWWEWQARQVAAAHQAAGHHMGVGVSPMAVPPPNVHPAAFYAQYYAQLGIAGLAPYQVAPNGIVPPSPRPEEARRARGPGGDASMSTSFNSSFNGGDTSSFPASADGSAKTSASSSPGASPGRPTGGFFRPSVPGTGFGFGFDRVQRGTHERSADEAKAGKHRRSSRGGRVPARLGRGGDRRRGPRRRGWRLRGRTPGRAGSERRVLTAEVCDVVARVGR